MNQDLLDITVCYAASARTVWCRRCLVARGSCVADAVRASGFEQEHPMVNWIELGVGVYGHRCDPLTPLANFDRIEICRPLVFDPKESRRRRAQHRREKLLKGEAKNG